MFSMKNISIMCLLISAYGCYLFLYFTSTEQFHISKRIFLDTQRQVFNHTCTCSVWPAKSNKSRNAKWKWTKDIPRQNSLCSDEATEFGPNQKVISFSLFVFPKNASLPSDSIHFNGIIVNAKEAQKFYPNWQIRIYTYSHPDFDRQLCELTCDYPSTIFICDIENLPRIGNSIKHFKTLKLLCHSLPPRNISGIVEARAWRFLPLVDPTVDIFISRDLDSRFRDRELSAVNEWLESNKTFHVMRDHPYHSWTILGGMWGAKSNQVNISMKTKYEEAMLNHGTSNGSFMNFKTYDQEFLNTHFYPTMKDDLISHDSYSCRYFKSKETLLVPFPVKRKNSTDFVGNYIFNPNLYPIENECPVECRPVYGKDWRFC